MRRYFIGNGHGYGNGHGDGNGRGDGRGYGDGNGDNAFGDGRGNGSWSGSGDGHGNGSWSGSGDGRGNGDGYGYNSGNGNGGRDSNPMISSHIRHHVIDNHQAICGMYAFTFDTETREVADVDCMSCLVTEWP